MFVKNFKMDIKKAFNPILEEVCTGEKFKKLIEINKEFSKRYENRFTGDVPTTSDLIPDFEYINAKLSEFARRIIDDLGLKYNVLKRQPGNSQFSFKVEFCVENHAGSTSKTISTPFPGVQITLWYQPPELTKGTKR